MEAQSLEEAVAEAREVLTSTGKDLRSFLYKEILLNALECKHAELDLLDLKLISRAVAEFRYAASIFKPYRSTRKVSIFGSARVPAEDPYYKLAEDFGRELARRGFMVITGAASGIMRAGIEGAGPSNSFGVNILLPFEVMANDLFQSDPKLITFRYFFTRKIFFVMEAHACALFPGGFGTHDEGFEVLTLLQTGKTPPMPLVLMELPGEQYWETWDDFVRGQILAREYISPEDLSLYRIARSPEEAADWITFYYSTYHSMRQVGDLLVLRLERELGDEDLEHLTESFGDLIATGQIKKVGPLPPERDEPQLLEKPRIAFAATRSSAGRLNQMILEINRLGQAHAAKVP